jgi:hypothetical protein
MKMAQKEVARAFKGESNGPKMNFLKCIAAEQ